MRGPSREEDRSVARSDRDHRDHAAVHEAVSLGISEAGVFAIAAIGAGPTEVSAFGRDDGFGDQAASRKVVRPDEGLGVETTR
jgi:hypothetical protein